MEPSTPCPFCNLAPPRIVGGNEHALAIRDAYPISPGHRLIIARRHDASFVGLSEAERMGVMASGESRERAHALGSPTLAIPSSAPSFVIGFDLTSSYRSVLFTPLTSFALGTADKSTWYAAKH